MRQHGTQRHNARLNPEIVKWIRQNPKGMTAKAQAEKLGVHYRTVEKVRQFESWRHVL